MKMEDITSSSNLIKWAEENNMKHDDGVNMKILQLLCQEISEQEEATESAQMCIDDDVWECQENNQHNGEVINNENMHLHNDDDHIYTFEDKQGATLTITNESRTDTFLCDEIQMKKEASILTRLCILDGAWSPKEDTNRNDLIKDNKNHFENNGELYWNHADKEIPVSHGDLLTMTIDSRPDEITLKDANFLTSLCIMDGTWSLQEDDDHHDSITNDNIYTNNNDEQAEIHNDIQGQMTTTSMSRNDKRLPCSFCGCGFLRAHNLRKHRMQCAKRPLEIHQNIEMPNAHISRGSNPGTSGLKISYSTDKEITCISANIESNKYKDPVDDYMESNDVISSGDTDIIHDTQGLMNSFSSQQAYVIHCK